MHLNEMDAATAFQLVNELSNECYLLPDWGRVQQ